MVWRSGFEQVLDGKGLPRESLGLPSLPSLPSLSSPLSSRHLNSSGDFVGLAELLARGAEGVADASLADHGGGHAVAKIVTSPFRNDSAAQQA